MREEKQRSDELLERLQQQRPCVNELERTKQSLAAVKKEVINIIIYKRI